MQYEVKFPSHIYLRATLNPAADAGSWRIGSARILDQFIIKVSFYLVVEFFEGQRKDLYLQIGQLPRSAPIPKASAQTPAGRYSRQAAAMPRKSTHVVVIDNLSSVTRSRDISACVNSISIPSATLSCRSCML